MPGFEGMTRALCVIALIAMSASAHPLSVGQADTFEDGTTQNWAVALGFGAPHPAPPVNVASGGPDGVDDNYLRVTSVGGPGAGSRLTVINFGGAWAGDYRGGGITGITMDVNNLGTTDLALRLEFANFSATGALLNAVISREAISVTAQSGWQRIHFELHDVALQALVGSIADALGATQALRLFHNPLAQLPPAALVASLGIDNITAVPVPAALWLAASGFLGLRLASGRWRAPVAAS